jgi:GNAT superfamily N-acetyltransferase
VSGPIRRARDHADLLAAAGTLAWVRYGVDPGWGTPSWVHGPCGAGGAVSVAVVRRRRSYGTSLTVLGPAAAELVDAVLPGLRAADTDRSVRVGALTVPRAAEAAVAGRLGLEPRPAARWEWMWTPHPPAPVPGEDAVRELDVGDSGEAARVAAFLRASSPSHSITPDGDPAGPWVGVRGEEGALLACGTWAEVTAGVPVLASIAVAPAARGGGLGAAVTAALTRRAFAAGAPACVVDMYSDNDVARRLYRRLGYRLDQEFSSWTLR